MITIDKNIVLLLDLAFNKVYDKVAITTISLVALAIILRAIFLSINGGSLVQNLKDLLIIVLIIMAAPSLFTLTENIFKEITYKIIDDKSTDVKMIYNTKPKTFIGFVDEYSYKSSGEKIVEAVETWLIEVSYWFYGIGYALAIAFFPIIAICAFTISMSLLRFTTVLILTFQSLPMTWAVLAYLRSYVLHASDSSMKASITTGLMTIISMCLSYFTYKIAFLGTGVLGNLSSHVGNIGSIANPIKNQFTLGNKAKNYLTKYDNLRLENQALNASGKTSNGSSNNQSNFIGKNSRSNDLASVNELTSNRNFMSNIGKASGNSASLKSGATGVSQSAKNPNQAKVIITKPKTSFLCEAHQPYKRPANTDNIPFDDEKIKQERSRAFKVFDMEGELK